MNAHVSNKREILQAQGEGTTIFCLYINTREAKLRYFLKFPLFVFISRGQAQTKTDKVAVFRKVSVKSPPSHISLHRKNIAVTGVEHS